jgi:hypothetical protein
LLARSLAYARRCAWVPAAVAVATIILALAACGGGETATTDETAATDHTATGETTPEIQRELPKKSCGEFARYRLTVEGDISCSSAHRVMRGAVHGRPPAPWNCGGPDTNIVCTVPLPGIPDRGLIRARF